MTESVAQVTARVINRILTDSGRPERTLRDEDALVGTLGLDSLDLAVLVVGMEQALGIDPFRQGARPVTTYGELVKLYESVLSGEGPSLGERSAATGRGHGA